ncbi:MAG: hypothetical protein LBH89_02740 [Lactococcus lactis]|jgi:hypothetical protein|nr:hypothetical protein [Lactococcus lactis]
MKSLHFVLKITNNNETVTQYFKNREQALSEIFMDLQHFYSDCGWISIDFEFIRNFFEFEKMLTIESYKKYKLDSFSFNDE